MNASPNIKPTGFALRGGRKIWSDRDILQVMFLLDSGWTSPKVAELFSTRATAIRTIKQRIIADEQPCECTKPENKDGGMPERWWA